MIKSMTGYGKASFSKEQRDYQIEIKSVNHRYLDISVKLPKILSYVEEPIKKEISSKVKRGKIDVFVTFDNNSAEGRQIEINEELAQIYIDCLLYTSVKKVVDNYFVGTNYVSLQTNRTEFIQYHSEKDGIFLLKKSNKFYFLTKPQSYDGTS